MINRPDFKERNYLLSIEDETALCQSDTSEKYKAANILSKNL